MGWDGICVYVCMYIERECVLFFRRDKQKGAAVIEEAATPPLSLPPAAVGVRFHNPPLRNHALAKHTPYSGR